jgi:hypothetical protein
MISLLLRSYSDFLNKENYVTQAWLMPAYQYCAAPEADATVALVKNAQQYCIFSENLNTAAP